MLKSLIVAALLLAGPGSPAIEQRETADILRTVIAREAKLYGKLPGDVQPCVTPVINKTTFDELRRHSGPQNQVEMASDRIPIDPTWHLFPWHVAVTGNEKRSVALDKPLLERLGAGVSNIVARPESAPLVDHVSAGWLSAPYKICEKSDAYPRLELSAPAVDGDFAFVDVDFECVLCGHGTTYVLQRTRSHWKIIASYTSWVS